MSVQQAHKTGGNEMHRPASTDIQMRAHMHTLPSNLIPGLRDAVLCALMFATKHDEENMGFRG